MCVFAIFVFFRVDAELKKNVVHDLLSTRTGHSPSPAYSGIVYPSTTAVVESAPRAPAGAGNVVQSAP